MSDTYVAANKLLAETSNIKCQKKPIVLKFQVLEKDEMIQTKEGPVQGFKGNVVLTGTKGERWPMPWENFEKTYNFKWDAIEGAVASTTGEGWKKPITVSAVRLADTFKVKPSWSNDLLTGQKGDVLVKYGDNDFGIVSKDIFAETYSEVE